MKLMKRKQYCYLKLKTAVIEDGRLFVFGSNSTGQLGLGDVDDRFKPTQVTGE